MTHPSRWWRNIMFGAERPVRRLGALTAIGAVTGFAESAVVLLVVHLASMGGAERVPLTGRLPDEPVPAAAAALIVLAVLAAAHLASAGLSARVAADAERRVRRDLVAGFLAAPWEAHTGERPSELQQLMMSDAGQQAIGTQQAATALSSGLNLVIVAATAIAISPWSTLGIVGVVVLSLAVVRPFRARTRRIARAAAATNAGLAAEIGETAQLSREIAVFGVQAAAQERLNGLVDSAAGHLRSLRTSSAAVPPVSRDITVAAIVLGLTAIAQWSDTPLAVLGASAVLLLRALTHTQSIAGVGHRLAERAANLERLTAGLARWRATGSSGHRRVDGADVVVELDGVGFTYDGAHRAALRDVTVRVDRGEHLGIVGRTGAGKTTLAGMLLGVLTPDEGTVRISGIDVADLDAATWRPLVAWVPQDPRLLSGTIADNVRFLRDGIDDARVREALDRAGLAEDLRLLPDGIAHDVGIAGRSLSGGQRQRIALARALVGRPRLLVLDEPTSALDGLTERAVRDALASLRGDVTVIVIAHRLSTLDACDRVLVLQDGQLIDDGPPQALARTSSYYREVLAIAGSRG